VIYLLTPILTALIGWLTNLVAVKMLFLPLQPKVIFGIRFQGLIPRRQSELAQQCAEIVERELFQQSMIRNAVLEADVGGMAEAKVRALMKEKLMDRLKSIPMIGAFVTPESMSGIEDFVVKEIRVLSEQMAVEFADQVESQLQVRHIVQSRIEAFDLDRLREIVEQVASKEFKTIEWVGAFLGFCVGLGQSLILYLYR
jgi:uncharacterized membrane protein YheB (UPF0754 family)